ncbi:MAG: hypothetical protein COB94_003430 [Gammaproteobacteria bacterium]|nr:hypothetical protein [Gammaproteobacteria bacterium]
MAYLKRKQIFIGVLVIVLLAISANHLYRDYQVKKIYKDYQSEKRRKIAQENTERLRQQFPITFMRTDNGPVVETHDMRVQFPVDLTNKLLEDHDAVITSFQWDSSAIYPQSILPLEAPVAKHKYPMQAQFYFHRSATSIEEGKKRVKDRITERLTEDHLEARESQKYDGVIEIITKEKGNIVNHILLEEDGSYRINSKANCYDWCLVYIYIT